MNKFCIISLNILLLSGVQAATKFGQLVKFPFNNSIACKNLKCCKEVNQLVHEIKNDTDLLVNATVCKNVIFQSDVGTEGFVLPRAGIWCLGEDITYNPSGKNPAIRIPATLQDDVILELNGHTIEQANKNMTNVIGIVVEPGLSHVTIKNGTIRDFSLLGIQAGTELAAPITELTLDGLKVLNNGVQFLNDTTSLFAQVGGILILNALDTVITNSSINSNFFAGLTGVGLQKVSIDNSHFDDNIWAKIPAPCTAVFGAQFFENDSNNPLPNGNILIRNSTFNNNLGNGQGVGLGIFFTFDITIEHCQFNNNTNTPTSSFINPNPCSVDRPFCFGMNINSAVGDIFVNNCTFNDNRTTMSAANGPFIGLFTQVFTYGALVQGLNTFIQNSEFCRNTVAINAPLSATATQDLTVFAIGLDVSGGSSNVKVNNCFCSNQSTTNTSNIGVQQISMGIRSRNSRSMTFDNVTTNNNSSSYTPPPGTTNFATLFSYGVHLEISNNYTFNNCTAVNNSHNGRVSQGPGLFNSLAAGFSLGGTSNVVFKNCVSQNNSDTNPNTGATTKGGWAAGFITADNVNSAAQCVFDNCVAESNTSTGTAAGFYLLGTTNSQVSNSTAIKNSIGILVIDSPLASAIQSMNNIINNNIVNGNALFGIQDATNNKTNAYYSNRAINNSATPDVNNYISTINSVLPSPAACPPVSANGTPIRAWKLSNTPCATSNNGTMDILDNISIFP